jgi:hypothetical protein
MKKPPRRRLLNLNLMIVDQPAINRIANHTMRHTQPSVAVALAKI